MTARKLWIQAGLMFVVLYVALLGMRPMITPDEPRYAGMAADMLATGEWLKLRMCGFVYYEKPPLGVWLIAASEAVFGHGAFAARLPGALATLASALAAGMVTRRLTGRAEAAPLGAMVQMTTALPMVLGTVTVLDPIFAGFVSLTLAWFLAGAQGEGRTRAAWLLASGAAAGLAFLTKGLLAFAVPALTAGGWLLWERRWREIPLLAAVPIAGAVVVAGPLAWLLHGSEPGFWRYFIEVEHLRRFANPDENQHAEPWWLLSLVLVCGSAFWLVLWPRVISTWTRDPAARSARRFCLAWVALPLLVLSLSAGKLPTYVLPLFPPISALVAAGLLRWRSGVSVSRDAGTWVAVAMTLSIALATLLLAVIGASRLGVPVLWRAAESPRWVLIGLAMLAWAALELRSHWARSDIAWLARAAWIPVPALLCTHLLLPDAMLSAPKAPWALLARHEDMLRSAHTLGVVNSMGHAVNWVTGRRDFTIVGEASEFDNELDLPEERARRLPHAQLGQAVAKWRSQGVTALVIDSESAARLAQSLGPAVLTRETDRDITVLELSPTK
ncbi:MAG: phospholipid carrier-dependent glycosyltransferase [Planctomycetes bacterium]|nr:phospholipid carrier-dependent glycosyltransferase [Planctomycetota bacterium]